VAKLFGVTTSSATLRTLSGFGCRFVRSAVVVSVIGITSALRFRWLTLRHFWRIMRHVIADPPALQPENTDLLKRRNGAVPRSPRARALSTVPWRPIAEGPPSFDGPRQRGGCAPQNDQASRLTNAVLELASGEFAAAQIDPARDRPSLA